MRRRLKIRGVLPCHTCGEPHNAYSVDGSRLAPQWAKGSDGHYYKPVGDPEHVLSRLLERGVISSQQIMDAVQ